MRKRPLNAKETKSKQFDVVTSIATEEGQPRVVLHEPKKKVDLDKFVQNHKFNFDRTFGEECDNDELYGATVLPLLRKMAKQARGRRLTDPIGKHTHTHNHVGCGGCRGAAG